MRKKSIKNFFHYFVKYLIIAVPLLVFLFGSWWGIDKASIVPHYEYNTRLFTDEELHLSPSEFFELCYNENLVVSIDFENFISYDTVYLAYLGDVVYTESHFYDDDSSYSYVINSNYWEFFYNQNLGESCCMIDNYGSELYIGYIYYDDPSDYFIFHVGNLKNFDDYPNFNDWFVNEAIFLKDNVSPSNVLGLIKNELVPDEYLGLSYLYKDDWMGSMFSNYSWYQIIINFLHLDALPSWIKYYPLWILWVYLLDICLDVFLFIPKVAHNFIEKGDDL